MRISNKAFLAPIDEYSNMPFRMLCTRYGADYTLVPLVSAKGIYRNEEAHKQVDTAPDERNVGVQLFDDAPEEIEVAVERVRKKFPNVLWFDLNLGCPSPRMMRCKAGAALLEKPKLIGKMLEAMKETGETVSAKVRVPRTLKLREELFEALAPADFIIAHGRTAKQGYAGTADWEFVRETKEKTGKPTVGNGDLKGAEEGLSRIKEGYCDAFMMGRVAMQNPGVFSNRKPEPEKLLREYYDLCGRFGSGKGDKRIDAGDLRAKAIQFTKGTKNGKKIREKIGNMKESEKIMDALDSVL